MVKLPEGPSESMRATAFISLLDSRGAVHMMTYIHIHTHVHTPTGSLDSL